MKLEEAQSRLQPFIGRRFADIPQIDERTDLQTDKGNVGKILEVLLGLYNTSAALDFSDGELKTNKCGRDGTPMETIFIKQISSLIDNLLNMEKFEESPLFSKIQNLLLVPVNKDGIQAEWMFLPPLHFSINDPSNSVIKDQLKADYYSICGQLVAHIERSGGIHTSNGALIQIRSKDAMPYNPIYSQLRGRYVSNKNHAFYFKKEFMQLLQSRSPHYPY